MKTNLLETNGNVKGEIDLPGIFSTAYKPELIKLAVHVKQSQKRQRYGADPLAGKRTSAHYHGRRKIRYSMMNKEMSRIPRIHGNVGYLSHTARFAPHAVKGRKAHPPKAEKIWAKKMNKKQMLLALKSAIAASAVPEIVKERGHVFEGSLPVIVENDFENFGKTRNVFIALEKMGLERELKRCAVKKVRAGKGKMRGRRYKKKKGPLIIASERCALLKAAENIEGVDACTVEEIFSSHEIEMLAPGTAAGRLIVLTENALKNLKKVE